MTRGVLLVVVLLHGCIRSNAIECADGRVCPAGTRCDDENRYCIPEACGNGVREANEACDGTDFGGIDCRDFGFQLADGLTCSTLCMIETASCAGTCGDHRVFGGETCDGMPPLSTCIEFGYDVGKLSCTSECGLGFDECEAFGWRQLPASAPDQLHAVWISDATKIAVGNGGTILVAVGDAWPQVSSGTTADLYGVWGSDANDVFAVGAGGTIVHFDGTAWATMPSGTTATLRAIAGTAANDVYAVGDGGTIVHYDGSAWSVMPSGVEETLRGVYATAARVIAVGDAAAATPKQGTILQRVGGAWSKMAVEDASMTGNADLAAVWGAGDAFTAVGRRDLVIRFDGTAWTIVRQDGAVDLKAVWGSGPNDVFMAGEQGQVLHYDGMAFVRHVTRTPHALTGIAGLGPARVFTVTAGGAVMRYDGTDVVTYSNIVNASVGGLWAHPSNRMTAVGGGFVIPFNGSQWGTPFRPQTGLGPLTAAAVHGVQPPGANATVFVAGDGACRGINGGDEAADYTTLGCRGGGLYVDVWAASPSRAYAVGNNILHFDGVSWTVVHAPGTFLQAVYGWSPTSVVAVGNDGQVVYGAPWTTLDPGVTNDLLGVWGLAPDDFYVVGTEGLILHYDGTEWTRLRSGTNEDLHAIAGRDRNDIFVGGVGILLHFDGSSWKRVRFEHGDVEAISLTYAASHIAGRGGGVVSIRNAVVSKEQRCDDIWNEDRDATTNCADDDCIDSPYCNRGGACQATEPIACGQTIESSTYTGIARIDDLACLDRATRGPEAVYELVDLTGTITVDFDPKGNDLAVAIVPAFASGGCDLARCTAAGAATFTLDIQPGERYYAVVDGPANVAGDFALTITCN